MSYIDFDYENNSILVCKGHAKKKDKIKIENDFEGYSEYALNGEFNGVKIKDFLSLYEQEGVKGESKFKKLLEKNNIPYLYIGQGPFGIERSGVLIDTIKSKRADFLVNIKDMGTLLFDVKCRSRIGFHNSEEKYFSLFASEIDALYNLQKSILMPVWLAFIDRETIDHNGVPIFYFISISTIEKYRSGLSIFLSDTDDFDEIKVFRIPNSLFTKIEDKIIFEVGYSNIEEEILEKYAKKHIGFNRVIKDKIKELIRNNNCYKSNVYNELCENIDYCFKKEIDNYVNIMIEKRIIDFKKRVYLKLVGE